MNTVDFKKMEQYQKEIVRLQGELEKQNRKLAALPGKYGFKTMDAFIAALKHTIHSVPEKLRNGLPARRRKRAVITDEIKQKVKSLAAAGKTGGEIAKAVGISTPSVQNIKQELGLVKRRKE